MDAGAGGDDEYSEEMFTKCVEEEVLETEKCDKPKPDMLNVYRKKGGGRRKQWPTMDLETNKNQSYETSHIRVITDDTYNTFDHIFTLACIHCELYLDLNDQKKQQKT